MADHIPAVISIGGVITADGVTDLVEAITSDGVTSADDGGIADETELGALIDGTGPLVLVHSDAPFGALLAIEAVCQELGLTFQRSTDAGDEYEAEILSWAPGMAEPRWTQGSQNGNPVMPLAQIGRLVNDPAMSDAEIIANLRALLSQSMPVSVPPLILSTA